MNPDNLVKVGKLYHPHSLKGEIKVSFEAFFIDYVDDMKFVFVSDKNNLKVPLPVEKVQLPKNGKPFIKFIGIDSRESVVPFQNSDVFVDQTQFENLDIDFEPEEDVAFFTGFLLYNDDDSLVGEIIDVVEMPNQLLATVKIKDKEVFVPIHEELIIELIPDEKKLTLDIPDGLLDL